MSQMPFQTKTFQFSQRAIQKLPPCPAASRSTCDEYSDSDVVGLKLQVSKSGRKVYFFRYTYNGSKRAARIGEFGALDVSEARKKALAMRAILDGGHDPQSERDTLKGMPTFREFSVQYLTHAYQVKRSAKTDESKLRLWINPAFGNRKLSEVTTKDIQFFLNGIAKSHSLSFSNRHHSLIARMFKLAVIWGVLERSPCFGLVKFREPKRAERFLTTDEIARFLAAMESDKNPVMCSMLKMAVFTGLRRSEITQAQWSQVDLEQRLLFLPKTKAGKPRYAVLNSQALELLTNLPSRGVSPWLFPAKSGDKPVENPKSTLLRLLERAGIERMRVHDLRHTFASVGLNAGANLAEIQALLGHASASMTERYAHLSMDSARRGSQVVSDAVAQAVRDRALRLASPDMTMAMQSRAPHPGDSSMLA
jgi:integrase